MKYKKILFAIGLFITQTSLITAQESNHSKTKETTKLKYFEIGIGLPSITFRERMTSSNAYSGIGLASLHLGATKQNGNKTFREFTSYGSVMNAKPAIANVSDWNKSATIINYNFMWRKLKNVGSSKNKNWQYFAGGHLSHNGYVAIIPSANNSITYNFNWLQAGLEGMMKRDFNWKNKKFQFTYQASLPILGVTVRPQSFIGLPPQSNIWEQDASTLDALIASPKLSSVHNNFIFRNDISLDMQLRKSKLRLQYFWQFTSSKVSVNSLNSVLSSVNIIYLIKLKNK